MSPSQLRIHGTGSSGYSQEEWGAEALLTDTALYLSGSGETAIFEISMMASEMADEALAKFDPQAGEWE